ncbi:MAG: (deoxy)nucleoside triphosphate pyrophosphohydrolase [Nitrospirota bacterium]
MNTMGRKHIQVTCAIIERNGLVLAAQRSAVMTLPLKWEFPGGKIRGGETPEECLRWEIREELGLEIAVFQQLPFSIHDYSKLTVTLHPFICSIIAGEVTLHEHADATWRRAKELVNLDWAAADVPVLDAYLKHLGG